jgi:hypothetical protein
LGGLLVKVTEIIEAGVMSHDRNMVIAA